MENAHSAQGRTAPGANASGRMQIERVEVTPRRDVYNPGDVINIAIYFQTAFVGQCRVGLVLAGHSWGDQFEAKTFAKSSNTLYEGQIYIKDDKVGSCVLRAVLAPVGGTAQTVAVGDQIFEVRPLVPQRR
ncbi:MAG: hypothetical protein JOZ28_11300 [Candidatus Eremiobacteraeota bacterium]|nr:hypothetical protein [Candidatus Eremiobacteraeota bacterium]